MTDLAAETTSLKQTIWGIEAELDYQVSLAGAKDDDARIQTLTDRLRKAHADLKEIERKVPKP
ncbi:hypothetical protein [Falsirhodobacter sp. 1013]|uniref:hypothetical protein n=1 Tax=Falsirhodobacter sp. 1013 TaxID=3417566 RepID=UPI003EBBAD81